MITKLTALACVVAATALTAVAAASPAAPRQRIVATQEGHPTHFAGFPPDGVKASTPTTGRLVLGLRPTATTEWNVYADGRIIWQKWTPAGDATVVPRGARRLDTGYVRQRLTLRGVQLLRSEILATGLFEHNLMLKVGRGNAWVFHQVRRGDRMVKVSGVASPDPSWNEHFTKATPAQTRALAWIAALVADPARWLPTSVWEDRQIRAFVPACYGVAFDRGYPDISKLPSPAGKVLSQYKLLRRHGYQVLTTGQAGALLQAFVEAGIAPSDNHAWNVGFSLGRLPGQPHPSYLHLSPLAPPDRGPLQARTRSYGGIGATVANFYAANPHGQGKPPAGTTYYRVDRTTGGRVSNYHVVVGWTSKRSASGLLARLTRELPRDAQLVKPYNGYCAVYRSRWLGKVVFGLPRRYGGLRVFRTGYIIVYAPTRAGAKRAKVGFPWNGSGASLTPMCRG
jgi:hypothetical protein